MKTCSTCKQRFPKTKDYFFNTVIKQKLSNGETAVYNCLRSNCKKCHGKKGEEIRIKKRCKEMNCDVSDYRENWKKQYSETRTKDIKAKTSINNSKYSYYLYLLRRKEITNFKEYQETVNNKTRYKKAWESRRKPLEHHLKYKRDYYKKDRLQLKRAYIANNILGLKVSEVPEQIIETTRLIIQLKKETNGK